MGKTIGDARAEVARMIEMVECACAIPTTMQGRILEDVSRNVDAETVRQPVGVCAAMVPFWFLPFAICCGNAFILKPSEQVPLTQQIAFEVLDSLGLPPGVVNLVNGGRETVDGLIGSAFGAAGQRCMAGSVVVTVGAAKDRVLPALREATAVLRVGDGLDEATEVGPVVSCAARDRVREWIDRGERDGARVTVDGRGVESGDGTSFVGPTIVE